MLADRLFIGLQVGAVGTTYLTRCWVAPLQDVLGVLSAFGGADAQADLDGNGSVDVNDVLSTLSTFGTACSTAPAPPPGTVVGGDGGSDGFNCCGGGAACGFVHCPALGDGQAGCVQPWALPNGLTMETCASVTEPATPACALGGDCGGQVQTSCGTNCPPTCGSPQAMICNLMCFNGFQCPSGGNANWFDPETGTCVAEAACTNDFGNSLPPGIALGRPFTVSARPSPTMSELVEGEW